MAAPDLLRRAELVFYHPLQVRFLSCLCWFECPPDRRPGAAVSMFKSLILLRLDEAGVENTGTGVANEDLHFPKNQVTPIHTRTSFRPRFGLLIPAQDMCMYLTSPVSARLSRTNQCRPIPGCRLNSKVPPRSG